MSLEEGICHIICKTLIHPHIFFCRNARVFLHRGSRLWRILQDFTKACGAAVARGVLKFVICVTGSCIKRILLKVKPGRSRKSALSENTLPTDLHQTFDRSQKAGVKFNRAFLGHW